MLLYAPTAQVKPDAWAAVRDEHLEPNPAGSWKHHTPNQPWTPDPPEFPELQPPNGRHPGLEPETAPECADRRVRRSNWSVVGQPAEVQQAPRKGKPERPGVNRCG